MDRINGAGHVGHLFVAEDASISRPPTEITAAWLNGIQEEVMSVITGAALVPTEADMTQLRQAIVKMIQASQRAVVIGGATFAPAVVGTGKAVYWDAANGRFDLAQADGSARQACVGFADVPNGNLYAFGDAPLFAGLTPGVRYYLDAATAGAITTIKPANVVLVGIARSVTEVFIDIDTQTAAASVAGIQGAIRKLTGSANGLSSVVTYAADELTTGDGAGNYQTLRAWSGTITMTTLGSGGLDVGVVAASTWYFAYATSKPDGTKAFIASLDPFAPSLSNAAGFSKFARIGAFRTDGTGKPLAFKQWGNKVSYTVGAGTNVPATRVMASGSSGDVSTPTWTPVNVGAFVPATAGFIYILGMGGASGSVLIAAPNNSYGAYQSQTNPPPIYIGSGTGSGNAAALMPIESGNIYYATNAAGGVACLGFVDNL